MPGGPSIWNPNSVLGSGVKRNNGATVLYSNPNSANKVITNTTQDKTLIGTTHGPMLYPATRDLAATAGASGWAPITTSAGYLYGTQLAQNYIIFSLKPTMYLAGIVSTKLATTAGEYMRHSVNSATSKYTRKIVTAGWNYVTGAPLSKPASSNDSFGYDIAIPPSGSRVTPGRLIFVDAGKTIVSSGYKPKTD